MHNTAVLQITPTRDLATTGCLDLIKDNRVAGDELRSNFCIFKCWMNSTCICSLQCGGGDSKRQAGS